MSPPTKWYDAVEAFDSPCRALRSAVASEPPPAPFLPEWRLPRLCALASPRVPPGMATAGALAWASHGAVTCCRASCEAGGHSPRRQVSLASVPRLRARTDVSSRWTFVKDRVHLPFCWFFHIFLGVGALVFEAGLPLRTPHGRDGAACVTCERLLAGPSLQHGVWVPDPTVPGSHTLHSRDRISGPHQATAVRGVTSCPFPAKADTLGHPA